MKPLTSYTAKLSDAQAAALKTWLEAHGYQFREVPYARFAAEKDKTNVVFYESGKLVVQGKVTQEFIEFVLEPEILHEARLGYEAILNPELLLPRIGVDESGKGDFFGPLCIAGAYINETVVRAWEDAGVQDSKNIGSDKRIKEEESRIVVVERCQAVASGDLILFRIEASHFLWKMVRKLTAFLVEIGRGNATAEEMAARLGANAANVEPTAPPSGLFLEAVTYRGETFDRPLEPIVPVIKR